MMRPHFPVHSNLTHECLCHLFIENLPLAAAIVDRNLNYLLFSQQWLSELGLEQQDIIGRSHAEVFPQTSESLQAALQRCLSESIEQVIEESFQRTDGSIGWRKWKIRPWQEETGAIGGAILATEDIAEHKQAEEALAALQQAKAELEQRIGVRTRELQEVVTSLQDEIQDREQVETALRESEAELQAIIDNCPSIIYLKDIEGRILRVNRQFKAQLNKTTEELKGKTAHDLLPKEVADRHLENDRKVFAEGKPILEEEIAPHDDGLHTYLSSKFPIFNAEGVPYAIAGISTDISDRKRTEQQLCKERDFNQKLIQNSPAFFVAIDADGTVIMMNESMLRALGYTADDVVGKDYLSNFIPECDRAYLAENFKQLAKNGQLDITENHLLTKEGEQLLAEWRRTAVYKEDGSLDYFFGVGIDITERKQTEAALQRKTSELEAIFQTLPDLYLRLDLDGTILDYQASTVQKFYFPPERFLGKRMPELLPSKVGQKFRRAIAQTQQTKSLVTLEYELSMSDGHNSYEARLLPLGNDQIIAIVREISDRKQTEESLRKHNALLHSILESTPDFIVVKDRQGRHVALNSNLANFFGLPIEDIIGKDDRELLPQEDARAIMAKDREVIKTGIAQTYEEEISDGSCTRTYLSTKAPWRDTNGNILGIVAVARDISDGKRAEAALRQSEEQLQAILDNSPAVIYLKDLEGRLLLVNRAFEKIMQCDRQQVIGKFDRELLPAEAVAEYTAQDRAVLAAGQAMHWEETFLHEDGLHSYWSVKFLLRDADGLPYAICGMSTDITARKQAEEALQRSESQLREKATQLEQTLRELQQTQAQLVQTEKMSSLGQLVAGVAHEINNPVNFIYGNLTHANEYMQDLLRLIELYQKHYPNPHPEIEDEAEAIDLDFLIEDLPKLLSSMRVGAERIQKIVLALRNFSRMDEAEVKEIDIHEGIDSTLMILHNRVKDKPDRRGIEIIKEYGNLPLVECYAGQLNQVFMNVLSNAIDALDERDSQRQLEDIKENPSRITIRTQVLNSQQVQIRIADNGPGMTEKVRKRLFEPFFTTKAVGKGTGLGLSISYQVVVEKHGGQLECISSPGNGAEFLITLALVAKPKNNS